MRICCTPEGEPVQHGPKLQRVLHAISQSFRNHFAIGARKKRVFILPYLFIDLGLTSPVSVSSINFHFGRQEAVVIKLDIVNAVVTRTNVKRTDAERAVETVFEAMKSALGRGQRIELRRFGVFNVKPRKTGIGRNPRTGEEVNIPPGKAVRFKPGKELQSI